MYFTAVLLQFRIIILNLPINIITLINIILIIIKIITVNAITIKVRFFPNILKLIIILIILLEIPPLIKTITIAIRNARYTTAANLTKILNI